MAVFSIIVLTLAAMMSNVSSVWLSGINMTDNYSKAETMLSVMDRDVKMMVLRRDLAHLRGGTPAPGGAVRWRGPCSQAPQKMPPGS